MADYKMRILHECKTQEVRGSFSCEIIEEKKLAIFFILILFQLSLSFQGKISPRETMSVPLQLETGGFGFNRLNFDTLFCDCLFRRWVKKKKAS